LNNEQRIAMIISVGGTPAPIVKSISEYKPEFISFFASQDTCDKVFEIKQEVIKNDGSKMSSEITLADDVNDLFHCFEKAEEAVSRVLSKGFKKNEVIVDYTGGTKNMSVALALAAVTHGFSFSYVGGKERTKEGVGIVVNGTEQIYKNINPWDFLAVEERKKIALLFNAYQFRAAKALVDEILERSTSFKSVFKKLGFMIEGYYNWDLFRHKIALDNFRRAKLDELIEIDELSIRPFVQATAGLINLLEKIISVAQKPHLVYILDLYTNAERRYEEGKVDDAILRLYRLVEMVAQERLFNKYGIDHSNVKTDNIPEKIRDRYIREYRSKRDGKIKIPQTAAFELLFELGDEIGKIFKENKNKFLDIQSSRNYSYLAHGFSYSKDRTYLMLRDFVLDLKIFDIDKLPIFPKIEI